MLNWWLTIAPNFLLTNQDDEPNFSQLRPNCPLKARIVPRL